MGARLTRKRSREEPAGWELVKGCGGGVRRGKVCGGGIVVVGVVLVVVVSVIVVVLGWY